MYWQGPDWLRILQGDIQGRIHAGPVKAVLVGKEEKEVRPRFRPAGAEEVPAAQRKNTEPRGFQKYATFHRSDS
jgi:hypothetical protein